MSEIQKAITSPWSTVIVPAIVSAIVSTIFTVAGGILINYHNHKLQAKDADEREARATAERNLAMYYSEQIRLHTDSVEIVFDDKHRPIGHFFKAIGRASGGSTAIGKSAVIVEGNPTLPQPGETPAP